MQKIILNYTMLLLLLAGAFAGCKKDVQSTTVYIPASESVVKANFDLTDTITYQVTLVGADYATVSTQAGNDIPVTLKIDTSLAAVYNQANHSAYPVLSADHYDFQDAATISKGGNSTPFQLIIKNGEQLAPFETYLLPVVISKAGGAQISAGQQTVYFVVTRSPALNDLPTFDRTNWTVTDFSTQEPAEGGGNGLGSSAIDGDFNTYWQSKWAGGEPGPPHYITIDMGSTQTIHGISIVDRSFQGDWAVNGHGQPKAMTVSLSTDGTNWVDDGSFQVPIVEPQAEIRFFLPQFKDARYFKITVTSVWATNSTNIAEIYAL